MFRLFQRDAVPVSPAAPSTPIPEGLTSPQLAAALLSTSRRQRLLEHIWQRTSLSRTQFDALYLAPINRFAELVQLLPASEAHHHAWPGGMLDHALEAVAFALKMRQSRLLPVGAVPETQAAQGEAWTAAIAYAALLHDIGKVAVDLHVEYGDGTIWHPWHGSLTHPYRFRYVKGREYRLHGAATGLIYMRVLDAGILDWLSSFTEMWHALLYVLAGQYEHAGVLGEIVQQADQASVAQALGGDPAKALSAPKHALQRKLLDGLRYLIREEFKLNQPQASDAWLTQDALWLVSKTVADKLRAHLLSQGIDGIPTDNPALFNVLQEHGIIQPAADGKAIWRARVTGENGWSNSFTFLRAPPALIWESDQRPEPYAGSVRAEGEAVLGETGESPAKENRVGHGTAEQAPPAVLPPALDPVSLLGLLEPAQGTPVLDNPSPVETPTPAPAIPKTPPTVPLDLPVKADGPEAETDGTPSGEHFIRWLRQSIRTRKIIINEAKAKVHTVAGTVFLVTPGIFQRYSQEFLQCADLAKEDGVSDWVWTQKQFERLRLHRKQENGLNIWTCEVSGPRKSNRLNGYLLDRPDVLFDQPMPDNPYLCLSSNENKSAR
ncbi:MAG: TraI domain-containing protein [Proteobacteria bacterium]|nr:TraI domain-containing protein [Pseudomonadota bacterium]